MKFETYVDACVPERRVILNMTLRPLSLGHYILGNKFQVGFFADDKTEISMEDLLVGLLICSMTFEDFLAFIEDDKALKQIQKWGKSVKKTCKEDKNFNIFLKIQEFSKYIQDGRKMPLFTVDKEDNKNSGCHWSMSLLNVLTSKLNYSRSDALNMSLALAFIEYCKYAETEGAITLISNEQEEMVKGNFDWKKYLMEGKK